MASTFVALCALLVIGSSAAERGRWIDIEIDDGVYASLLATSSQTFRLRPSCLLSEATVSLRCGRRPELLLRLELWTRDGLRRARRALIDEGYCRSGASCRVLPFQAIRFGVRDQDGRWEAVLPWTFPAGPLPSHQRFRLQGRNLTESATAANCTDTARGLTPAERSQLESLFVELVSVPSVPGGQERSANVSFSQDNMRWAAKRLGLRLRSSTPLVDGQSLRKLVLSLLRMRKDLLDSLDTASSLLITRNSIASLKMALVAYSARYSPDMRSLLAQERKPDIREIVYVLKKGPLKVPLSFAAPFVGQESIRLQISVQVPPRVQLVNDSQYARVRVNDSNDDEIRDLRQQLQTLKNQTVLIMRRLNISLNAVPYLDLIPIKDCREAFQRGLPAGIFLLAATNRPVKCSADGSLVALRRTDGKENFDRDWKEYVEGFGDARTGDYWIGLRYLASQTRDGSKCLKLTMRAVEDPGQIRTARYSGFRVAGEEEMFKLTYDSFRGDVKEDSLSVSNEQPFTTKDRDHDSFPGNCAKFFKSGGWFRSCYGANLFGPLFYPLIRTPNQRSVRNNSHLEGMCWRGVMRKDKKCQPLASLEMAVGSSAGADSNLTVVLSKVGGCTTGSSCKSTLSHFKIPSTARYVFTAGGGEGGYAYHAAYNLKPGGRGAVVRAEALLEKGTELGIVVGCGGRNIGRAGSGGNATWVVDKTRRVLLLVAGGGGGSSRDVPGQHGRATEQATDGWHTLCSRKPTTEYLLQHHFPTNGGGLGWTEAKVKLFGPAGTIVGTGGKAYGTHISGGGGGYNGGGRGPSATSPASGGGSFCNRTIIDNCRKEAGGNVYGYGWLLIQKYTCF